VASFLDEVLGLLAVVRRAEIRNERLDLGIAWTAHELRAPLLSLRGFLDLQAQRGGELREEYFQAHRELDELVQELEGLLRWATGARELHRRPTDLVRLVREAVGVCTEGSSLEVSVSGPTSAPVVAEPGELRRAIANVVRNAIAYSPRDEAIDVSIERRDGSFVVSVRDRGRGVSAEEADSIFDPFVRGLAARGHRGGRGLGLFIARKVIEAHRGTIWVEPGRRGATFRIQVPR
jgi:signal transduction histidine kinase